MKTILITGGAGFIGSNFVHYLFNKYKRYKIIVLDALTYAGFTENFPINITQNLDNKRFEFWYGNVTNAGLVDTLVKQSDWVVHFAAETHVSRSIYDDKVFFETDVLGTQTIVNAVCKYKKNIERFIHISTSEVYGTAETKKMSEKHPLNPASPYAAAKVGADRLVYSYWRTYGIPLVIVRPFNNYGPRQHLEKVIPRFITSILLEEPLRLHGKGLATRDFIYVNDVCTALDLLLYGDKKDIIGEVFNIGSDKHRSIASIANDIIKKMGAGTIQVIGDRPGQVVRHTADSKKLKKLGWKPTMSWNKGLENTIDWYIKNRRFWEQQLWARDIPIITLDGTKELH